MSFTRFKKISLSLILTAAIFVLVAALGGERDKDPTAPVSRIAPQSTRHTEDDGQGGIATPIRRLVVWWTFGRGNKDVSSTHRIDAEQVNERMLPALEAGDRTVSRAFRVAICTTTVHEICC